MNESIIVILLLISSFFFNSKREVKNFNSYNDLAALNLKGKVKSVYVDAWNVEIQSDTIVKGQTNLPEHYQVIYFNEIGMKSKELGNAVIDDFSPMGKYVDYEYETVYNYLPLEQLKTNSLVFDTKGKIIRQEFYEYDSLYNLRQITTYNSELELRAKVEYLYNNKNEKTFEKFYDSEERLDRQIHFQYYPSGKIREEKCYKGDIDTLYWKNIYFYDSLTVMQGRYIYLPALNEVLGKNELYSETVTYYNEQGELLYSKIGKDDTGFSNRYKYKYDRNENWIEKIEYHNGKPDLIYEREIEYY